MNSSMNINTVEGELKGRAFDITYNAIVLFVCIVSYVLVFQIYKKATADDFRTFYASCFVFIVPCMMDGLRELLSLKNKTVVLRIVESISTLLSILLVASLLVLLVFNVFYQVALSIFIYGIAIYLVVSAYRVFDASMDLYITKKKIRKNYGR